MGWWTSIVKEDDVIDSCFKKKEKWPIKFSEKENRMTLEHDLQVPILTNIVAG
jgi:hypothetical protein